MGCSDHPSLMNSLTSVANMFTISSTVKTKQRTVLEVARNFAASVSSLGRNWASTMLRMKFAEICKIDKRYEFWRGFPDVNFQFGCSPV
jgi:hypothetical protein